MQKGKNRKILIIYKGKIAVKELVYKIIILNS